MTSSVNRNIREAFCVMLLAKGVHISKSSHSFSCQMIVLVAAHKKVGRRWLLHLKKKWVHKAVSGWNLPLVQLSYAHRCNVFGDGDPWCLVFSFSFIVFCSLFFNSFTFFAPFCSVAWTDSCLMVLLLCFDLGGHFPPCHRLFVQVLCSFRPYQKLLGVVLVVYRNSQEFLKGQG